MNTAELRRDTGIARAAAHADRVRPNWGDTAYNFLVSYCRIYGRGHELHCEAMRELAVKHGAIPEPIDGRAWGNVFRRAARAGLIRKTGRYVLAKSSNLSPKPVWTVL